jgi:hypothetical protein
MNTSHLSSAVRYIAAAVFALVTAGCFGGSAQWREVNVGKVPLGDAWTAMEEIAAVDGYPVDAAATDRGLREFTSRWRSVELPFRKGSRRRVHARFAQGEDDSWTIRYYVEVQTVDDIAKAFEPTERDWSAAGQDAETESRFAAKLRTRFEDSEQDYLSR